MSKNPEAIRWQEPRLIIDEKEDITQISLGLVDVPADVDLETTEKVLALITELVNQMIEEDILPELLSPDNTVSPYDDLSDILIPADDDDYYEPDLLDDDEGFDDF